MPTVLRHGPYRFFFYSGDLDEPRRVHVERDERCAKLWLAPVRLEASGGFRPAEIARVRALVEEHEQLIMEAWDEFFRG